MKARKEHLGTTAAVKGTMVQAHLSWAQQRFPDAAARIAARIPPECGKYVSRSVLATDWIPFRCIVAIDRAIAAEAGGPEEGVYRDLGQHSALLNLGGVYKSFVQEEPHRFFEQMALLHGRFQNFGRSVYERLDERAGRNRIEGCTEYSPVFCASALGYYESALRLMKVPGPVRAIEATCQCAGDEACVYEMGW